MKYFYFMGIIGLLIAGPSFDASSAIFKDMALSKGSEASTFFHQAKGAVGGHVGSKGNLKLKKQTTGNMQGTRKVMPVPTGPVMQSGPSVPTPTGSAGSTVPSTSHLIISN